jgi:hypothetical protein
LHNFGAFYIIEQTRHFEMILVAWFCIKLLKEFFYELAELATTIKNEVQKLKIEKAFLSDVWWGWGSG